MNEDRLLGFDSKLKVIVSHTGGHAPYGDALSGDGIHLVANRALGIDSDLRQGI